MKKIIVSIILIISFDFTSHSQSNISLGAYYFNGWYPNSVHITKSLTDTFPEREPKWGWYTGTQDIVNEQINAAADAGLSFFSFCWFYRKNVALENTNKIISMYLNSPNRSRLQYCLMVANHQGFEIGPADWPAVVKEWVRLFKTPGYLTVNGKPLIIFFSMGTLATNFLSAKRVKNALDSLRTAAQNEGLAGVTIAACTGSSKFEIQVAEDCGFDVLTGYNYHTEGIKGMSGGPLPMSTMATVEKTIWNSFTKATAIPYIPVATLNWDPRPWANAAKGYGTGPYLLGYSANTVYNSVESLIDWIQHHKQQTTKEKIALMYAWNEYGEGAYLTPSKQPGNNPLEGVKRAMIGQ